MNSIWAKQALTEQGWQSNVLLEIDALGRIQSIKIQSIDANASEDSIKGIIGKTTKVDILLPSPSNLHSHSFQRAMAGLAEQRSSNANDSFWTWRKLMYRLVDQLSPEDMQAIAAFVQMEMLEAGFCAVAEFHYLHHQPGGAEYSDLAETSNSIIAAAEQTGIGLCLLPVLYQQGGCDGRALNQSQQRFENEIDQFARLIERAKHSIKSSAKDNQLAIAAHSLRAVNATNLKLATELLPQAPFHLHIAEQQAEVDEVRAFYGKTPVAWLLDNFKLDQHWCLVHATKMDKHEATRLAKSGAVAGLCPITESSLGDGIFAAEQFVDDGGIFGVGSDSNIRISLAEELRCLEYSQRLRDFKRAVLSTTEKSTGRVLYDKTTLGGAQALARESGQIAVGHWADLVALDANAVNLVGLQGDAILDAFIFTGDNHMVCDVWSAGRHLVQQGRHLKHDTIRKNYLMTIQSLKQKF